MLSFRTRSRGFYRREAEVFMEGKVIPIKPIPKLYICMDATGVPVVKAETVNRKGRERTVKPRPETPN